MGVPVRCESQIRGSMSATSPQPESLGAAEIDFFGSRGSGNGVGIGRACVRGGVAARGLRQATGEEQIDSIGSVRSDSVGDGWARIGPCVALCYVRAIIAFAHDPYLTGMTGRRGRA